MPSHVTATPPAAPSDAAAYYAHKLALETDCSDVRESMQSGTIDFVLLDVRGAAAYAKAHVPAAISLPHRAIKAERMMTWPHDTLFVVYCAGPHCNGADKAALKLARLGRPVKVMMGGMTGWADEGFPFEHGPAEVEV
jgi:rhodanese-related sulfurtransferase